jgi:hypothetical protein
VVEGCGGSSEEELVQVAVHRMKIVVDITTSYRLHCICTY